MSRLQLLLTALIAAVAMPVAVQAQFGPVIHVTDIIFGSVSGIDYGPPGTESAFKVLPLPQQIQWESEDNWSIWVVAQGTHLGTSDDNVWQKPLGDLQFRPDGSTIWTEISDQAELVVEGSPGIDNQGTELVHWRVRLAWAQDRPGTYGTTLIFTIQPPVL